MNYNTAILKKYVANAPLALAIERVVESKLYPLYDLRKPVLDIGCGEGLFAHIVFKDKIETGIDPDTTELRRANELGAYSELLECYGNNITKPDSSFNTIISNSVLEHIPDIEEVFVEAYRLLKPGGCFYFTVPSDKFEQYTFLTQLFQFLKLSKLEKYWRGFFNKFWVHYHCYTPNEWGAIGVRHGFKVEQAFAYCPKKVCMLNTFLTPFGLPGMIIKKTFNKWVVFPKIRSILLRPILGLVGKMISGAEKDSNGGLVFVALRKPLK